MVDLLRWGVGLGEVVWVGGRFCFDRGLFWGRMSVFVGQWLYGEGGWRVRACAPTKPCLTSHA